MEQIHLGISEMYFMALPINIESRLGGIGWRAYCQDKNCK